MKNRSKNLDDLRWTTRSACAALGVPASRFFNWRQRYAFPGPSNPTATGRTGDALDFTDCVLLLMANRLTTNGVEARMACWSDPPIRAAIEAITRDLASAPSDYTPFAPLLAVDFAGRHWVHVRPETPVCEALQGRETAVLLDLRRVVADTAKALGLRLGGVE